MIKMSSVEGLLAAPPLQVASRNRESRIPPGIAVDQHAAHEARLCLRRSSYLTLRSVSCEFHAGTLVLRGAVPSYHEKQVAQEIVRKIKGVGAVVNALEVDGCVQETM